MFRNIKVNTRLWAGFGLMIVFILSIGGLAIVHMHIVAALTVKLHRHPFTVSVAIADLNTNLVEIRDHMKTAVLAKTKEEIEAMVQAIDTIEQENTELLATIKERYLGDKTQVEQLTQALSAWAVVRHEELTKLKSEQHKNEGITMIISGAGREHFVKIEEFMKKIAEFAHKRAALYMENAVAQAEQSYLWIIFSVIAVIMMGTWIAVTISRSISRPLNQAVTVAEAISSGNLNNNIVVDSHNELGKLLQTLADMQTQLRERIQEDKRITEEALRINQALNNVTTSVLITDNNYKVIYANRAAQTLFTTEAHNIRKEIPRFDADHILGGNVDFFHKNPSYQRGLLAHLSDSRRAKVVVGGVTLEHIITPVVNNEGERLGVVIEFNNRTLEVATEREINEVIEAASQGNFNQRIAVTDKTGFFKTFGESINQILDFNQLAIQDLIRIFSAVAKGDLTQTITNDYSGELEQLKNDANATVKKLTDVMTIIKNTSETVSTAAQEISQGNTSLSQRTEEQAASLEQTSASMEQMTGTVQQNADNARQATQLAVSAKDRAEQGSKVVSAAVQAIAEINKSSKKITDIIGVIDEIAFQTNLLALNAAVEAARAGEQGRGFAVVAAEVRNLAQRSAAAAKEIKALIQDSVNKVEEGTELANKSGQTLEEIVIAVKKVNDIITEIAAASAEQSAGIHQVNKAVAQMDDMTQQNAALVEEASAASESMSTQAQELKRQVAFFKLGELATVATEKTQKKPTILSAKQPSKPMKSALTSRKTGEWVDF